MLYGDNGTGKSSISDAFEWFYKDKVEHLSGEEIGRKGIDALRNIFLVEKFGDYQILLFTHEKDWFEIVSNMVRGKNWLIKRMYWDHENGATIEPLRFTLKEEIENKLRKADTTSLGNSIRIYLEHLLKEICHDLKVKVEFRFKQHNESRMSHIGEGAVVRYIESTGEVVGLTLIGVKEGLLKSLKSN